MNDSYDFGLARPEDAAEVMALYRSLIGTPGCAWSENYPALEFVEADIAEDSLFVLRDKGRIIAAAAAGAFEAPEGIECAIDNPRELSRLGVLLNMQGRGIGGIILRHVIEAVRGRGFDGICLLASKDNPAALALYEKNGFMRRGEVFAYGVDFYYYENAIKEFT
ncbi:MAG: GNAT family N-acetyltransferase [Clostridiales bacterium]|jgi:ribosomal protein S18 acetylase RimI-like enzyme|nr:GNAT family N-acetyltransferase [Clostridiales bacterium]